MVAAFNDVEFGDWRQPLDYRSKLVRRAERVAAALNEQHRPTDGRQVRIAPGFRTPGRMEWVTKQDEAPDVESWVRGGDLGCDPTAHRFAPDKERSRCGRYLPLNGLEHRAIAPFEQRRSVRRVSMLFGVEGVERDEIETSRAEGAGELYDESAALTCASAVPEDESGADAVFLRFVYERRGCGAGLDRNEQRIRIFQERREPPPPS